jgi:ribose 5-phosphate isomerase A
VSAALAPADQRVAWKRAAADRATELVRPGMVIGLGAGSTAELALERIASLVAQGALSDIVAVPCSRDVSAAAERLGIPLTTLDAHATIDLTIDGADEVDRSLTLIKGGGGALLHEKMVAQASRREVIVVDASKQSHVLGTHHALPVEVVTFGWRAQVPFLESLGARVQLRMTSPTEAFRTEHGNLILDCMFGPISSPRSLARCLSERAGIVEHGLFIDLATDLIVTGPNGTHHYTRERRPA